MTCKAKRTTRKRTLPKGYELTEEITIDVTLKSGLGAELTGLQVGVYTITETVSENPKKVRRQPGPNKITPNLSLPGPGSIKVDGLKIKLSSTRELHDRIVDHTIKKMPKMWGVVYRGWIVTVKDSTGKLVMAKGSSLAVREQAREFKILPKGVTFASNGLPKGK